MTDFEKAQAPTWPATVQEIFDAKDYLSALRPPTYEIWQAAPSSPKRPVPAAEYFSRAGYQSTSRGPGSIDDATMGADKLAGACRQSRTRQAKAASGRVVIGTERFALAQAKHFGMTSSYETMTFSDKNVVLSAFVYSWMNLRLRVPGQTEDFATGQQVNIYVRHGGAATYSALRVINDQTLVAATLDTRFERQAPPHFNYGVDFRPAEAEPERVEDAVASVRKILSAVALPSLRFSPGELDQLAS